MDLLASNLHTMKAGGNIWQIIGRKIGILKQKMIFLKLKMRHFGNLSSVSQLFLQKMIEFIAKYSPLNEGAVPQVAGDRGEGGPHGRGGGARAVTRRIACIARIPSDDTELCE